MDELRLSPGERILVFKRWKKEHPELESDCEASFLTAMLDAQLAKTKAFYESQGIYSGPVVIEQAKQQERKEIAHVLRILESWGQLDIKGFPLVTALVERLESGQALEVMELRENKPMTDEEFCLMLDDTMIGRLRQQNTDYEILDRTAYCKKYSIDQRLFLGKLITLFKQAGYRLIPELPVLTREEIKRIKGKTTYLSTNELLSAVAQAQLDDSLRRLERK